MGKTSCGYHSQAIHPSSSSGRINSAKTDNSHGRIANIRPVLKRDRAGSLASSCWSDENSRASISSLSLIVFNELRDNPYW